MIQWLLRSLERKKIDSLEQSFRGIADAGSLPRRADRQQFAKGFAMRSAKQLARSREGAGLSRQQRRAYSRGLAKVASQHADKIPRPPTWWMRALELIRRPFIRKRS